MNQTPNTLGSWADKFNKQYTTGGEWWKEGMEITPTMIKCFIGNLLSQDRKELCEKIDNGVYGECPDSNSERRAFEAGVEYAKRIINNHKAE